MYIVGGRRTGKTMMYGQIDRTPMIDCPVCGSKGTVARMVKITGPQLDKRTFGQCSSIDCPDRLHTEYYAMIEEAIEQWNLKNTIVGRRFKKHYKKYLA